MSLVNNRGGFEVIAELLSVTREMASKLDDPEFLVDSINRREKLMEEYDSLKARAGFKKEIKQDMPQINRMISEIVEIDKQVDRALKGFRDEVKRELKSSNRQKNVLKYANNAISSTGSYMDIKE